jgi:Protein of unknown function (DUF3631)/Toprim-like
MASSDARHLGLDDVTAAPPREADWSPDARAYFERHGIELQVAKAAGVTESAGTLTYPYRSPDGAAFERTRPIDGDKTFQPSGVKLCLWSPFGRNGADELLILEGESDLLAAATAQTKATGKPAEILWGLELAAIPGAGFPTKRVVESLNGSKVVYLALDGDKPGRKKQGELADALRASGVEVVPVGLPDDRDVADVLAGADDPADALATLLADAGAASEQPSTEDVPAPAPAEVRELLDAVRGFYARFLVLSEDGLRILALWTFHTWAFEAAETTPYPSIRSPERSSGKTRAIEVAVLIAHSPEQVADASVSAIFRSIKKFHSTLLFDEVDGIFKGRDEDAKDLKRLLNSGYRIGANVLRTVGEKHEPGRFSTFSPKLLAGIGGLPDTLESRCIPIPMHRRLPHEPCERLRVRVVRPEAEQLTERLADIGARSVPTLQGRFPEIPDELGDRAADCAEPLLAIADLAGGDWPALARKAYVALQGGRTIEDESVSTRLLADIYTVFGGQDRISSRDLLNGLHGLEEAPWEDWFGRPLTAAKLNRLLHDFGIHSRDVRFEDKSLKGFHREQFEDAWSRYLPSEPRQRDNPDSRAENGHSFAATSKTVSRQGKGRNPALQAESRGVAAETAEPDAEPHQLGIEEYVARFHQRNTDHPPCSCVTPADLTEDGRCSRCYGWPEEADS